MAPEETVGTSEATPREAPLRSPTSPVLAGGDDAVLLGDDEGGADGVLVPLYLAQEDRAAALRTRVNLGRHLAKVGVRRAPDSAGGGGEGTVITVVAAPPESISALLSGLVPPTPEVTAIESAVRPRAAPSHFRVYLEWEAEVAVAHSNQLRLCKRRAIP